MNSARTDGTAEVSLVAEFNAHPEARHRVASLVTTLVRDVRAEPGNIRFDAWVEQDDDHHWIVFETYADDAAFQAHLASPHCHAFNRELGPLVEGGSSRLTWVLPTPPQQDVLPAAT